MVTVQMRGLVPCRLVPLPGGRKMSRVVGVVSYLHSSDYWVTFLLWWQLRGVHGIA